MPRHPRTCDSPPIPLVKRHPVLHLRRTASVLAAWALLAAGGAQAQPDAPAPGAPIDPLAAMLVERGLLPAATPQAVRKVSDAASELVLSAMNFLGVRYRRGGNSTEDGFDCSGFTRHVFENSVGLLLPRRADEQARLPGLASVAKDELKPGDLVFFNTMRRTFSHVGIYVGDGKFIHAPKPGASVRIEDMREAYWTKRYTGARRAPIEDGGALAGLRKTLSGYLNSDERGTP
jgi:cell wall-associated NlpC family hydrolase